MSSSTPLKSRYILTSSLSPSALTARQLAEQFPSSKVTPQQLEELERRLREGKHVADIASLRSALFSPPPGGALGDQSREDDAAGALSPTSADGLHCNRPIGHDDTGLLPPNALLSKKALERRRALHSAISEIEREMPNLGGTLKGLAQQYDEFIDELVHEANATPSSSYFHALAASSADVAELEGKLHHSEKRNRELEEEIQALQSENAVLREAGEAVNRKCISATTALSKATEALRKYEAATAVDFSHIAPSATDASGAMDTVEPGSPTAANINLVSASQSLDWVNSRTANELIAHRLARTWDAKEQHYRRQILDLQAKCELLEVQLERYLVEELNEGGR